MIHILLPGCLGYELVKNVVPNPLREVRDDEHDEVEFGIHGVVAGLGVHLRQGLRQHLKHLTQIGVL